MHKHKYGLVMDRPIDSIYTDTTGLWNNHHESVIFLEEDDYGSISLRLV